MVNINAMYYRKSNLTNPLCHTWQDMDILSEIQIHFFLTECKVVLVCIEELWHDQTLGWGFPFKG